MAMVACTAALPVGGISVLPSAHAARPRIQSSSSSCAPLRCNANIARDDLHRQQSAGPGAVSNTKGSVVGELGGSFKLSSIVVPMLAAALVGSVQPTVQASEWDRFLVPVDDTEIETETEAPPGDGAYNLMQRIRERRAKVKSAQTAATEEKSNAGATSNSLPFYSPPVYSPPAVSAPQTQQTPPTKIAESASQVAKQIPAEIVQKENNVVGQVEVEAPEKQKTHGFLPLFLSQFLLLAAYVGGGYVLITTPESKWEEAQKTVDGYVMKATPVVKDLLTKVKPVAIQAQQKAQQFAETAKPYVVKTWNVSKPLAEKAVEASKPVLKEAQIKAAELWQQATSSRQ